MLSCCQCDAGMYKFMKGDRKSEVTVVCKCECCAVLFVYLISSLLLCLDPVAVVDHHHHTKLRDPKEEYTHISNYI